MRKPSTWLLVALVGGLVAGCGSGTSTQFRTQTIPAAGATAPAATTTAPTAAKTTSTGATTSTGGSTSESTSSSQTTPTAAKTTSTGATRAGTTSAGPSVRQRQRLAKKCTQALAERTLSAGQRLALEEICKTLP
jgi:hypothetical protein